MSIDGAYKQVDGLNFMVSIIRGHNQSPLGAGQDSFKTKQNKTKKREREFTYPSRFLTNT